jgi:flagellar basal body-associated protein FliL
MAKKKDAAAGGKKSKKKLIIGAVVGAALLYNFVLKPKPEPADENAALAGPTTIAEGDVVPVEELVLNLADTDALHYVRVGVAVVLAEGASAEEFEMDTPIVSDIVVDVLSERTMAELREPGAKESVKEELTERVREEFNPEEGSTDPPVVARVVFTSFVMQ